MNKLYPIQMEVEGRTAMWTRPDTGDCPCSYPAPTYSAVKAIIESVLYGPTVNVYPTKVEICAPICYQNYTTNYSGPLRKNKFIKDNTAYQQYATVLVDVCYRIYAEVALCHNPEKLTEAAARWNKNTTSPAHAYQEIFNRRLKRGQSYATISLGWSEFTASYFGPFREKTKVCSDIPDIVISSMFREAFPNGHGSDYSPKFDTNVVIHNGVLVYKTGG